MYLFYMIVCVYFYSEMGKIVSTTKKDIPELKAWSHMIINITMNK